MNVVSVQIVHACVSLPEGGVFYRGAVITQDHAEVSILSELVRIGAAGWLVQPESEIVIEAPAEIVEDEPAQDKPAKKVK